MCAEEHMEDWYVVLWDPQSCKQVQKEHSEHSAINYIDTLLSSKPETLLQPVAEDKNTWSYIANPHTPTWRWVFLVPLEVNITR